MTKKSNQVYEFLMSKPGYLKWTPKKVQTACRFHVGYISIEDVKSGLNQAKIDHNLGVTILKPVKVQKTKKLVIKAVKAKKLNSLEADTLIKTESTRAFKKNKVKRLFFDIETSYNIVKAWRLGYNLSISSSDLIHERSVICVCWKWEGESRVNSLEWDKDQDDKKLLIDFIKILNSADEVFAHNGDRFDIKWLRTRCLYHGIQMQSKYNSVDTLKLAKKYFYLNSNKLDYIGQFTGVGKKMETGGLKLWDSIILDRNPKAMDKMVKYCKVDVIRLQQVYDKIKPYIEPKSHLAVSNGGDRCDCPSCGSNKTKCNQTVVLASGMIRKKMHCNVCGKNHTVPESVYNARKL